MKNAIISQLLAALEMLQDTIGNCPDELWEDLSFQNPYWHVVYHTLYYVDQYTYPSQETFQLWEKADLGYHILGSPKIEKTYSKVEMSEYLEKIKKEVPARIMEDQLEAGSGFEWLAFNRFEMHLYTIRHTQHHVGQLMDRLRSIGVEENRWVGMVDSDEIQ